MRKTSYVEIWSTHICTCLLTYTHAHKQTSKTDPKRSKEREREETRKEGKKEERGKEEKTQVYFLPSFVSAFRIHVGQNPSHHHLLTPFMGEEQLMAPSAPST